jgi:hypothetical protein
MGGLVKHRSETVGTAFARIDYRKLVKSFGARQKARLDQIGERFKAAGESAKKTNEIMDKWVAGTATPEDKEQLVNSLTGMAPIGGTAYHGTPHTWAGGKPDLSKVGTGQGAQSYGHGLYFAENKAVAESYKLSGQPAWKGPTTQGHVQTAMETAKAHQLSGEEAKTFAVDLLNERAKNAPAGVRQQFYDAINNFDELVKGKTGTTYEVDIPDEHIAKMLDWDKPLSQQPEIKRALKGAFDKANAAFKGDQGNSTKAESLARLRMVLEDSNSTGQKVYETLHSVEGHGSANASKFLNKLGIPGIKYLDQGSRTAGQGTRNFVVFDTDIVKSVKKMEMD